MMVREELLLIFFFFLFLPSPPALQKYWITLDLQFPPINIVDLFDEATMFNVAEHGYVYLASPKDEKVENGFFMCDISNDAFFESYVANLVCAWVMLYSLGIGSFNISRTKMASSSPNVYAPNRVHMQLNVQSIYVVMQDFIRPHYFRITHTRAEVMRSMDKIRNWVDLLGDAFEGDIRVTVNDVTGALLPEFIHNPRHYLVRVLLCAMSGTSVKVSYTNPPAPWFVFATKAIPHRTSHFISGIRDDV